MYASFSHTQRKPLIIKPTHVVKPQVGMPLHNEGMLVVSDYAMAADLLELGYTGIITWGPHSMYAMVCKNTPEAMTTMGKQKGRDPKKKPFFQTTSFEYAGNLLTHANISPNVQQHVIEKVYNIFEKASRTGHPIGVLLSVDTSQDIVKEIVGTSEIHLPNGKVKSVQTTGMMVSGTTATHYNHIVSLLPNHITAGTSSNLAGLGNGSGHHRAAPLIGDFHNANQMFIFLGGDPHEGVGTSTSIVYIEDDGSEAYMMRRGSLTEEEVTDIVTSVGIPKVSVPQNIRHISAYDYSTFPGGEEHLHSIYLSLTEVSRNHTIFEIPVSWAQQLTYRPE